MKACKLCNKVKFYSINYLFSDTLCNECYIILKEKSAKEKDDILKIYQSYCRTFPQSENEAILDTLCTEVMHDCNTVLHLLYLFELYDSRPSYIQDRHITNMRKILKEYSNEFIRSQSMSTMDKSYLRNFITKFNQVYPSDGVVAPSDYSR
ncbi:MAG: hypothetical protein P0116_16130 [Candidatus Nitrosocosmicus sp.]|nr:hypothetical protein [Candidatus Nitrosocosmicus sp.]